MPLWVVTAIDSNMPSCKHVSSEGLCSHSCGMTCLSTLDKPHQCMFLKPTFSLWPLIPYKFMSFNLLLLTFIDKVYLFSVFHLLLLAYIDILLHFMYFMSIPYIPYVQYIYLLDSNLCDFKSSSTSEMALQQLSPQFLPHWTCDTLTSCYLYTAILASQAKDFLGFSPFPQMMLLSVHSCSAHLAWFIMSLLLYAEDTKLYPSFTPNDPIVSAQISACLSDTMSPWMEERHLHLTLF